MAYVHQTPLGMRKPKRKAGGASPSQGRARAWFEIRCACGNAQRTALGRRTNVCAKCKTVIPGPWS